LKTDRSYIDYNVDIERYLMRDTKKLVCTYVNEVA